MQRKWSLTLLSCFTATMTSCAHQGREIRPLASSSSEMCAVEVRNGTEYVLVVSSAAGTNRQSHGEIDPNGSVSFGAECAARSVSVYGVARGVFRAGGGRPVAAEASAGLKPGETVQVVLRAPR